MELSPQSKQQIDTILRFEKWTSWGFGILVVSAVVGMLIYASYWDMPESFILVLLVSVFALMISIETTRFLMWRRFVKNGQARKLLTLRYTIYLIGVSAIGYYGIVVFYETPQPQSFQAFLLLTLTSFTVEPERLTGQRIPTLASVSSTLKMVEIIGKNWPIPNPSDCPTGLGSLP